MPVAGFQPAGLTACGDGGSVGPSSGFEVETPQLHHPRLLLAPREHRLTMLLRESLATHSGRTTMIAHVSDSPACHAETLGTVQLAARIHRLRRKKVKVGLAQWGVGGT